MVYYKKNSVFEFCFMQYSAIITAIAEYFNNDGKETGKLTEYIYKYQLFTLYCIIK